MNVNQTFFHQIVGLVQPPFRMRAGAIVILLVISSLMDVVSIGAFVPVILVIVNPDLVMSGTTSRTLFGITKETDPQMLGIYLTLFAVFFTIIKTLNNIWITRRKAQFAYEVGNALAEQAIAGYFKISYHEYQSTDFTKEMNRISNLPINFSNNIIIPFGTILSESLIVLIVILAVAFQDLYLFFFLMVVISPVGIFFVLRKRKIKTTSDAIKEMYPRLLKYTLQAIEALPEIRIFRKELFFKQRFDETNRNLGRTFASDHTAHTSSSRLTEIVAAVCIGTLILYVLITHQTSDALLFMLTIYAAASFRIIPSVNRILAASMQIRSYEYVVHELHQLVARNKKNTAGDTKQAAIFQNRIELSNISFGHNGSSPILKDLNLTINKGEKILVTGKSGGGKTTLLMILMDWISEHDGKVMIDGVTAPSNVKLKNLISYVPQNPYIVDTSILANVAFGIQREHIDTEKVLNLMRDLDLETWINSLPSGIHTIIGERGVKTSGGQRQRLALARALYYDAEVLLLDEITNQLDSSTELEIVNALRKLNDRQKTIILVTHRPERWDFFDSHYDLHDGQLHKVVIETLSLKS